jgi:hypothetical protein
MHLQEPVLRALQLRPQANPLLNNPSRLPISQRHLLNTVYFERRSMQHLLNGSRLTIIYRQRNHLVNTDGLLSLLQREVIVKGAEP